MSTPSSKSKESKVKRSPGRPPDDAPRDTPSEILGAAERLFGAGGYEATSLRQIASAANVDLSTVKYHFDDKARLFAEVYKKGHCSLIAHLQPELENLSTIKSRREVREQLRQFVDIGLNFVHEENDFVRLALYRIMENSEELEDIEAEIEDETIEVLEGAFIGLRERNLIGDIHIRSLIILLMTGLPMWEVSASTNPHLLNYDDGVSWPEHAAEFIHQLLCRTLLVGEDDKDSRG